MTNILLFKGSTPKIRHEGRNVSAEFVVEWNNEKRRPTYFFTKIDDTVKDHLIPDAPLTEHVVKDVLTFIYLEHKKMLDDIKSYSPSTLSGFSKGDLIRLESGRPNNLDFSETVHKGTIGMVFWVGQSKFGDSIGFHFTKYNRKCTAFTKVENATVLAMTGTRQYTDDDIHASAVVAVNDEIDKRFPEYKHLKVKI